MGKRFPRSRRSTAEPSPSPVIVPAARATPSEQELLAMLPTAQVGGATLRYRGPFEGLWTDREDFGTQLDRRLRSGQVSEQEAALLTDWVRQGYVLLPEPAPEELCAQIKRELGRAFEQGDERLRVLSPGDHFGQPLAPGTDPYRMRINDAYVFYESVRQALFFPPLARFLSLIFDSSPVLMQSLSFESGSAQGFHRDTMYVIVDPPLALAASWIALEDVRPGSGELAYYEGSHALPGLLFHDDTYKSWHPTRDGIEEHDRVSYELIDRCEEAQLPKRTLMAKEGDVLIWSADLVHAGLPITDPTLSRRSLVGHYCPEWAVPKYFDQFPEMSGRRPYGPGSYASTHYRIVDAEP